MTPLALLSSGEKGEVVDLSKKGFQSHLIHMGIVRGKVVEVLSNQGRGPIVLKIDESRIVLGRGLAMKIMVRRLS